MKHSLYYRLTKRADHQINFLLLFLLMLILFISCYAIYDSVLLWAEADRYKVNSEDIPESLAALYEKNPDIVGWIEVEDTQISYPIVQGKTNFDYLQKDALGNYQGSGSIFLDSKNQKDFSDTLNVLYGHNMTGGKMFANVKNFVAEIGYLSNHPTATLYLLNRSVSYTPVAAMTVSSVDSEIYALPKTDQSELEEFVEFVNQQASVKTKNLDHNHSYLILSTCTVSNEQTRYIVILEKEEENEA